MSVEYQPSQPWRSTARSAVALAKNDPGTFTVMAILWIALGIVAVISFGGALLWLVAPLIV